MTVDTSLGGPFVQFATICEKVLREQDGVASLIRLIDRMSVVMGKSAGAELPDGQLELELALGFRSGAAVGRYPLSIRALMPSGEQLPDQTVDVHFDGGERGVNLFITVHVAAIEGLYWFDVYLNGTQLLTRVPFRVIYQRVPSAG